MGGVEAGVGGRDEGGVRFPGLGLVVVVAGGGGGGGGGRGRAGGAGGEADVVHADGDGEERDSRRGMEQDPPRDVRRCKRRRSAIRRLASSTGNFTTVRPTNSTPCGAINESCWARFWVPW
ncbi:hypothetical protein SEVIR_5G310950v4 [Setaria viridis]